MSKYDGFYTVPEHARYQLVIGKPLSFCKPIDHRPEEDDSTHIQFLIRHVFGEQYELGMNYLQPLYLHLVQKLSVLLLISEERNTGKSTLLSFLKTLFQNSVTLNTNKDSRSQFNSDWADKLLIPVGGVLLNRREDGERLKNLSTTLFYKMEARGKDRDKVALFVKFVLCSNNEYLPAVIDAGETCYWVRKIDRLQSDDTNFLRKLKAEVPTSLHFLQRRNLSTEEESHMWFTSLPLHTEVLRRIIHSNRNRSEIETHELVLDIMESVGTGTLSFCPSDILMLLVNIQVKAEKHQVRKVLQEYWKLTPTPNGLTYIAYQLNYNRECRYEPIRRMERYYTTTREQPGSL